MVRKLTGKEAGLMYVAEGARCGNCFWFDEGKLSCSIVSGKITEDLCCNGWTPARRDGDLEANDYSWEANGQAFRDLFRKMQKEAAHEEYIGSLGGRD